MKSGVGQKEMIHWYSPIIVVITGDAPLDGLSTYLKEFLLWNINYCD
jgi:hypothetical protein